MDFVIRNSFTGIGRPASRESAQATNINFDNLISARFPPAGGVAIVSECCGDQRTFAVA